MSLLTRIGNAFKAGVRAFDAGQPGAGTDRRWPAWASQWAPNRQQLQARHLLASRSSYVIANSPTGTAISDQMATALIGDGPTLRHNFGEEPMARGIERGWNAWAENVSVTEDGTSLAGFLANAVRSIVSSGEAVVQLVTTERGDLRLRLLNSEQLDPARTRELEDMTKIIAGVEFDPRGRRVAYWIYPQAPDLFINMLWHPIRIPAEDVCHVFDPRVPGQVRGVTWLAPVLTTILQIDQLQDALLARANTAALFAGFISDPSGTSGLTDGPRDPATLSLEPGVLRELGPDASITFSSVPDTGDAPALLRHMLRSVASALSIPYELLTGDLTNTNYSSAKMGLEGFKRRVQALRETMIIAKLLRPIFRRWITLEILSGRLQATDFERDPEPYFDVSFLFPSWASLDPYREAQADAVLLNSGLRSRAEIIASRGRDIADVDREIASDGFIPRQPPAVSGNQGVPDNAQI